jgi:hypothetical protein
MTVSLSGDSMDKNVPAFCWWHISCIFEPPPLGRSFCIFCFVSFVDDVLVSFFLHIESALNELSFGTLVHCTALGSHFLARCFRFSSFGTIVRVDFSSPLSMARSIVFTAVVCYFAASFNSKLHLSYLALGDGVSGWSQWAFQDLVEVRFMKEVSMDSRGGVFLPTRLAFDKRTESFECLCNNC